MRKPGLRGRMLLLITLAVLPAVALAGYNNWEQRADEKADALEGAMHLAHRLADDQNAALSESRQLLTLLAQHPEVRGGDVDACSRLVADVDAAYPRYAMIGLIDVNGFVTCSSLPFPEPVNAADRTYFQRALTTGDFAVGDYQVGRITGEATVNMGYPVRDDGGDVAGVLFVALRLDWLTERAARHELPEGSVVTVVGADGRILARVPDGASWIGKSAADASFSQVFETGRDAFTEAEGVDGVHRLYAFTALGGDTEGEAPVLTVGIPVDAVLATVDATFHRNLAILGVVGGVAAAAAVTLSERAILKPVHALLSATRRLSAGDLSARVDAKPSSGEIAALARTFDEMAGSIERRENALKAAESDLRAANERLRELDRLKTTFINTAAHELRTPLTPIRVQLHVLRATSSGSVTEKHLRSLEILDRNTTRLGTLVDDILDVARLQAGRFNLTPAAVDVNRLVLETVESYEAVAVERGVTLDTRLTPNVNVHGDAHRLTQVLFNLLSNAFKFTPEGGRVSVTTASGDGEAVIRVEDKGIGVRREDLEKLFQPFAQVHEPHAVTETGTGLGLFICRGIVEAHGGTLTAESDGPGAGCAFTVRLPLQGARGVEDAPAGAS